MFSTGSAGGSWFLWLWFGCCCSCFLLFLWRTLNNWWECDFSSAQRLWAASLCRVTPLCALEQSISWCSIQPRAGFIQNLSCWTVPVHRADTAHHPLQCPACPRALLELGMCRQAVKCVVFSSTSSVRHFLTSLENQRVWIGRDSYRSSPSTSPGVSACAPAASVVSEYPQGWPCPFPVPQDPSSSSKCPPLVWPSHLPVPFVTQHHFNLKKQSLMYFPWSDSSCFCKNVVTCILPFYIYCEESAAPWHQNTKGSVKLR